MDYRYLYDFNKERYQKLAERQLTCREDLTSIVVEQGYLLPNRYALRRLFGHGGVLDADKNYVKRSEINAFSKYATTPEPSDEMEIYMGEGYEIEEANADYLDEDVVYLGYINNHWGHFLLDSSTRLYPFLKDTDKKYKYAFLVNEGQDYVPVASIARFLELLGITEQLLFINKVTKCRSIIIPEQGYMINSYYSKEHLSIFDKVVSQVDCTKYPSYEKVYYSRANFKKAQGSEVGEEILLDLFQKNNFTIVSPEKCTLDEQIAIVRNSELLVGITGTIPHNLYFAKPGQKMLIINKTHNLNVAQMDINIMRGVDVTYVDAYLAKFPSLIGNGPFFINYSSKLNEYVEEKGLNKPAAELLSDAWLKQAAKIYEHNYRMENLYNLRVDYCKDKSRFDYFHPQHLIDFEEKIYVLENSVRLMEKLEKLCIRVKNKLKSMKK